jgi:hypothetical protein
MVFSAVINAMGNSETFLEAALETCPAVHGDA